MTYPCPKCSSPATAKHIVERRQEKRVFRYYICKPCGCAFRTMSMGFVPDDLFEAMDCRSPDFNAPRNAKPKLDLPVQAPCPDCGKYSPIVQTFKPWPNGERWRKHKCDEHGFYHSVVCDGLSRTQKHKPRKEHEYRQPEDMDGLPKRRVGRPTNGERAERMRQEIAAAARGARQDQLAGDLASAISAVVSRYM